MSDKNKILKFLIQVIGWGLVFGFPLFFTWKEGNPMTWVKFLGYVGVPIAFITVFYAHYFIFIDSFKKSINKPNTCRPRGTPRFQGGNNRTALSIYSFLCC